MSSYEVGDWTTPTLTVSPFDGTTVVTLAVISPAGVTTAPTVTPSGGGATWTGAPYEFTAAGEWIERWTVTGTGKGKERRTLLIAPDPTDAAAGGRVYATTTDYATWLHAAPPTGSRRALAAASRVVDEMLLCAVYAVDPSGLPTDATVIRAVRDATCAQAEHARSTGDANLVGAGTVSSFSVGKVSVTKGTPQGTPRAPLPAHWSPAAWRELTDALLTGQPPREW